MEGWGTRPREASAHCAHLAWRAFQEEGGRETSSSSLNRDSTEGLNEATASDYDLNTITHEHPVAFWDFLSRQTIFIGISPSSEKPSEVHDLYKIDILAHPSTLTERGQLRKTEEACWKRKDQPKNGLATREWHGHDLYR